MKLGAEMEKERLIYIRKVLGLTQPEMAEALGVSLDTYKSWESTGRKKRPIRESVAKHIELLLWAHKRGYHLPIHHEETT